MIASERVMEQAPLESACRGSVNGRCSGRTKPVRNNAGALHDPKTAFKPSFACRSS